jgi:hypothetical protein
MDQIAWHEFVAYWKLLVVQSTSAADVIKDFTKSLKVDEDVNEAEKFKEALAKCEGSDPKEGLHLMREFLNSVGARMEVMGNSTPRLYAATDTTGEERRLDNENLKRVKEIAVNVAEEESGSGEEPSGDGAEQQ